MAACFTDNEKRAIQYYERIESKIQRPIRKARNLSDSSDISSSLSDEEEVPKRKNNKLKVHQIEDRATSKFYTKDDSQEDLPYVADNVFKVKKTKQKKYKTKFKSKGQSSFKSNKTIDDSKEINYANNYAPNNLEKSYLNNPVAFMKTDIKLERTNKRSLSSSEDSSDSDSINCFSNHGLQSKTEPFDGASCSRTIDSDSNESDDHPSKTYGTVEDGEKSNKGMSLMKKSGYKEGEGLGKNAQGLVNPVQLPTQKGRRGLGFASREPRESFVLDWDPEQEESADILKVTEWLENEDPLTLSIEDMNYWFETGEKKLTYNQTTEFADSEIFKVVNCSKNVLDNIDDHDFRHARTKANPFETVKNGIFQNRAAMKMANIDWACDFMFTDPKYNDGSSMLTSPSSLLYFADICAGPGGFSEYVLWRKSWKAKGVGFTLRNANDFKLNDFYAGSPESFEAFYGHDEDGDVYKPKNILSLERYVMKMTEGKGVHFVMADGGFSVDGQESFQEILSKRLYLCQALAALSILQPGGHFMCKLFDIFTEFSAGLLFLLYQSFKQISIYKPVTSRPANSERYVICKWRLDDIQDIKQYLFNVNLTWNGLDSKEDILSIVPLHEIQKDTNFFRYLWDSNNKLGQIQALSLSKIVAYTKDQRLADDRQKDLKKKCLELWEVKDGVRRAPFRSDPKDTCNSLITGTKDFLQSLPEVLNKENLRKHVKSVYDWHCVLLNNSKPPTYFLSLGGSQVYELVNNQWVSNEYLKSVMMSPGTLVYGELAIELEGEDLGQLRVRVLHIIDAYKLGNIDISNEHYLSRINYCKDFAKSMNKIESDKTRIRVKEPVYLETISDIFEKIDFRWSKFHRKSVKMYMLDSEKYCCASGILFIKATLSPWVRALSRTYKTMYYGHPTKQPIYEEGNPVAAYAPFRDCRTTNKIWFWMDEFGNPLKNPSLEQEDLEKLIK